LLGPASAGRNGYRYYDRESLLRELDVPLREIQGLLNQPELDLQPVSGSLRQYITIEESKHSISND